MFIHMLILSENVEYTSQEETWKIIKNDTDFILQSKLHMPKTIFKSLKMPIKIWISHINALLIHLNPFIHYFLTGQLWWKFLLAHLFTS